MKPQLPTCMTVPLLQTLLRTEIAGAAKSASEVQNGACHQPKFRGLNKFPRVSRQNYPYLVNHLQNFRDSARISGIVSPTVKSLTAEQIEALAQYPTSL